jgi:flagellar hook-associated protein 3 FlgL
MIAPIDPAAEKFLADLERIRAGNERAQREITSGIRVGRPSDGPEELADILQVGADIARIAQVQGNLQRAKGEVDTGAEALEQAIQLVDRARVLALETSGTMVSAGERQTIAQEVQGLLEELVSLSRTTYEGRYIFSGDSDSAPSYELDLSQPNGVNRLLNVTATRQIQDPSGNQFPVAKTAEEIFDGPSGGVFAAVNALRTALLNNSQAGIVAVLGSLQSAADHVNLQLSFYGTVQSRIDRVTEVAHKLEADRKVELSRRRDADVTESILALEHGQSQEKVALSAHAAYQRLSLLDFLD